MCQENLGEDGFSPGCAQGLVCSHSPEPDGDVLVTGEPARSFRDPGPSDRGSTSPDPSAVPRPSGRQGREGGGPRGPTQHLSFFSSCRSQTCTNPRSGVLLTHRNPTPLGNRPPAQGLRPTEAVSRAPRAAGRILSLTLAPSGRKVSTH